MGWIVVAFDLPVLLPEQRKEASRFRKDLLNDGFVMLQFSLYTRPCTSWEKLEKHVTRLKNYCPSGGNVRTWFMTDKQWEKSFSIMGKNYNQGKRSTDESIPQQTEFW